jgi:NAD(P)H dehydrogenase (quinone)
MAKVLIVYATGYGNTGRMAQAAAEGVNGVDGAEAILKKADEATLADIQAADALMLGTPVHMGSMDWQMKKFIDEQCSQGWMSDSLVGKVAGVFACGSGYGNTGAGAELTMLSMLNNLAELGMIIVPLPKNTPGYQVGGLQWGAYARAHNEDLSPIEGGAPAERLEAVRNHGANLARAALALAGKQIFA